LCVSSYAAPCLSMLMSMGAFRTVLVRFMRFCSSKGTSDRFGCSRLLGCGTQPHQYLARGLLKPRIRDYLLELCNLPLH
jgi:hypothetical protein